jgi:hypothetical protein
MVNDICIVFFFFILLQSLIVSIIFYRVVWSFIKMDIFIVLIIFDSSFRRSLCGFLCFCRIFHKTFTRCIIPQTTRCYHGKAVLIEQVDWRGVFSNDKLSNTILIQQYNNINNIFTYVFSPPPNILQLRVVKIRIKKETITHIQHRYI